jgi:hypothetical protein
MRPGRRSGLVHAGGAEVVFPRLAKKISKIVNIGDAPETLWLDTLVAIERHGGLGTLMLGERIEGVLRGL